MKKNVLILCFTLLLFCKLPADFFENLLIPQEQVPNTIYYQLLPAADDKNPGISFIKSRESKTMSLEDEYLEMLDTAFTATKFIETGTYDGGTTAKAAYHWNVETIELSKELAAKAKKRFAKNKEIKVHHGDSIKILPTILKSINDKPIIFLDAHFSMHDTAKGSENTPILTELDKIKHSKITDAILIIDDIRMFDTHLTSMKDTFAQGYPTLNQVVEKILTINDTYQCAIVYDTLIAFTADEQICVSPVVKAVTMSRLYDGQNYLIDDIILAELCIAHAKDKEKEALADLAEHWIEAWSQNAGLSRHYALWMGLLMLEHEDYTKAKIHLLEAKKRGLKDWRIDWYIAMAEAQCFFDIR